MSNTSMLSTPLFLDVLSWYYGSIYLELARSEVVKVTLENPQHRSIRRQSWDWSKKKWVATAIYSNPATYFHVIENPLMWVAVGLGRDCPTVYLLEELLSMRGGMRRVTNMLGWICDAEKLNRWGRVYFAVPPDPSELSPHAEELLHIPLLDEGAGEESEVCGHVNL